MATPPLQPDDEFHPMIWTTALSASFRSGRRFGSARLSLPDGNGGLPDSGVSGTNKAFGVRLEAFGKALHAS
jgi:hypothetical protein